MGERDVETPYRAPDGRTVPLGYAYDEAATQEPFFAPSRIDPKMLEARGFILGEATRYFGAGVEGLDVRVTIVPDLGRDTDGETIEGKPIVFWFHPSDRNRRDVALPRGLGLKVVRIIKPPSPGRPEGLTYLTLEGYSRYGIGTVRHRPGRVTRGSRP